MLGKQHIKEIITPQNCVCMASDHKYYLHKDKYRALVAQGVRFFIR